MIFITEYNLNIEFIMSEVTESVLFRQKLYENFKQSGLLSHLKTNLRMSLLEKLQKPQARPVKQSQEDTSESTKPLHLRDKFLVCLMGDYLIKAKKEYSLAILLPESNMDEADCLSYSEMGEIINFQHDCSHGSLLEDLVDAWMKIRCNERRQRSTQTDYNEPVSKKLEEIDRQYRHKIDYWKLIPSSAANNSAKGQSIQPALHQQSEAEKKKYRQEVQMSVKAELQKKYQTQYQFRLRQIEKIHEGRLSQLKTRQRGILDSLQRKTREIQEQSRRVKEEEMAMIRKYEAKIEEAQVGYRLKARQIEEKQKQFWRKQLQIKAKKREYEDSIRLLKQKVVEGTLDL